MVFAEQGVKPGAAPAGLVGTTCFERMLRIAQTGDAVAQFEVGDAYLEGIGVAKDVQQALAWYRLSAAQGNPEGQYRLGRMFRYGDGTAVDAAQALVLYRQAADRGLPSAMNDIGVMYMDGIAVERDLVSARGWFLRAAQAGYALAQRNFGSMVERGLGGPRNEADALAWYSKAAENGDVEACYRAGNMLFYGLGVPVNFTESVGFYKLGAAAGGAGSMERLGHMYLNGYGVEQDPTKAVALFQQSIALGFAKAKLQLAWCLEDGTGIAKDEATAMALYMEGAANSSFARKQLVMMVEDGRGAPADPARAAAMVAAMAADGDVDALANLAATYRKRMQLDRASAMYATTLRAFEKRTDGSGKKSEMVFFMNLYAGFNILTDRFAEADALLRKAMALEEAEHGPLAPGLIDTLEQLAVVQAVGNHYSDAIKLLERAQAISKAAQRNSSGAASQLGAIALLQDRTQDAERHFRAARSEMYGRYPIGDRAFARNDAKFAGLLLAQGKYPEAGRLLAQALKVETNDAKPEPAGIGARTAELATVYLRQNRLDEAFALSGQALAIVEKQVGSVRGAAAILTQLGTVELRRRHLPQAHDLLTRALALNERITGPDNTDAAATLYALAELALAQGESAQAGRQVQRALAINERALGPDNTAVARDLDLLGQVYVAQSALPQAAASLERAWKIRRDADIASEEKSATATRLAAVYRTMQRETDARALDAWLAAGPTAVEDHTR
jgi:TPR repeat protein